jgi:hypothetical protein
LLRARGRAGSEQVVEGWRELGSYGGVGVHEDADEECLVEELLDVIRGGRVCSAAGFGQVEGDAQVGLDSVVEFGSRSELSRHVVKPVSDAVLLPFEYFERDGSRVVGFHEFVAFAFQFGLALLKGAPLGCGSGSAGRDLLTQSGFHARTYFGFELDGRVVLFDALLDFVDLTCPRF